MKTYYIFLLSLLVFGSCTEFDDDINMNPNQPGSATATQLIANSQLYLPGLSSDPQGEFYAQYLSETQYVNASLYDQVAFSFYSYYAGSVSSGGPLSNLQKVLDNPELAVVGDGPPVNQLAVAKILKAYFFWHITDRWGDIPYTEALSGLEDFTPAYDTQESVYDNLFTLLKTAGDEIESGTIANDIIYDGDMERWKKLSNTIRMLMALRLSKVDPAKGQAEFNEALDAGILESNEDNLVFKHLAEEAQENYWYDQIVNQNRLWWALSEPLVNLMKPVEDPRLYVYAQPNSEGEYIGLEYGREEGWLNRDVSLLGTAIYEQDTPVYLVTYSQALFALAEAAKLGWIGGGDAEAKQYYEQAIEESLKLWTGSVDGLGEMMAYAEVAYDPANAIEQIATQRYLHLFMHGYEAWAEWRRTGYPELTSPGGRETPRRQGYTEQEKFNNEANYQEAIQRQFNGEDGLYNRIWWDK